jgi:16S rRNA (guanine527-N7)-methyltransferase
MSSAPRGPGDGPRVANPRPDADAAARLDAVLQALRLPADAGQRAQLLQYLDLLQRWNRVYNLTAVRDPERMLSLHLADSLSLLPALDRTAPRRVLDVGSGGGLPGMVLAIMRPQWQLVLVEAVQKKCAFLRQVAATLRLHNVQVEHARVEQLELPGFDCITSRAVGDLAELVRISEHLLLPGGAWAAMKGSVPQSELQALPATLQHEVEALQVPGLQAQRCVVWLRPRQPGRTNPDQVTS